ncbi:hypothetical protein, partial [Myxococcus sp. AB025B]|uniref:hypothetical protein n=1 Tax=Myxococcus sp. AB025B TaxID=2562794 RepID=UPI001E423BD2
ITTRLVGSEMGIRDRRVQSAVRSGVGRMDLPRVTDAAGGAVSDEEEGTPRNRARSGYSMSGPSRG